VLQRHGLPCFRWPSADAKRIVGRMLSHEEFLAAAAEVARRLYPDAEIGTGEDFCLTLDGQVVFLENVYRKAAAEPERCEELLEGFLLRVPDAADVPDEIPPWEQVRERIMPQIFPRSKVTPLRGRIPLTTQEFVNDTVIVYVIDEQDAYRSIRRDDLQRWGVDMETVHRQALENLTSRSTGMQVQAIPDEGGNIIATIFQQGDAYDSSRLLLPALHENLRPVLGSPFLAGIPNRDFLVCFRTDADDLRDRLAAQIAADFGKMPYPITDQLFLVTADGVAPWREKLPGQE
jgi:uncharacterized protein YtpQ (UPF0354 family)